MKVNDYVRTKNYGIAKITRIDPIELVAYTDNKNVVFGVDEQKCVEITGVNKPMKIVDTFYKPQDNEYILDYNSNIIDLIEDGDYVNGYLIAKIYDVFETSPNKLKEAHIKYADEDFISQLYDTEIKSILTKEQFERCEYKI